MSTTEENVTHGEQTQSDWNCCTIKKKKSLKTYQHIRNNVVKLDCRSASLLSILLNANILF